MSNTLEVLKRIVREEYQDMMDGVNIHPNGFRDYTKEKNSDFDEPHSTEKMESVNEGVCCDSCNEGKVCCSVTEKVNEELMNENPAAAAAAAMAAVQVMNAKGNKIKGTSALRSSDPSTKRKAVGIFKRLKDKFSKKKEPVDKAAQYRALVQKQKDDYNRESVKLTKTRIKEIIREEIQTVLTEGTRWNVGIETPNGKIASTYGHWDGYPEFVGKMLKRYYSNTGKVKQLLKLGKQGISSIDKSMKGGKDHTFDNAKKGETIFFGRDRGEKSSATNVSKSREDLLKGSNRWSGGTEFMYIWSVKEKKWYYVSRYSNPQDWKELK